MPYRLLANAASRATGRLGWLRGAAGALVGVLCAGIAAQDLLGAGPSGLWLVGPIGASAVLVFALPASPLAQPWPLAAGSVMSLAIGLLAGYFIPYAPGAAALAVGGAIAVMALLRCLHPPGGACALVGAIAPAGQGWEPLLLTLMLNLAVLGLVGWLYNTLTGHRWPHDAALSPAPARDEWVARYEAEDLDAVLETWDEVLDVTRDDLDALFRAVEQRVEQRTLAQRRRAA